MMNLPCQKRRHIIVRSKDGEKSDKFRCANTTASTYRDTIGEKDCKRCCLRRPLVCITACNEAPPSDPVWDEPHYTNQGDIAYPARGRSDTPPPPQGYTHQIQTGRTMWHCKSTWGVCLYRQFMNKRGPRGDLQVIAHCSAQRGKIVSHGECVKCTAAADEIGGLLSKQAIEEASPLPAKDAPDYPTALKQMENYGRAIERWIAAGWPTRSREEVRQIHEDFCAKCDWYDPDWQRCKGCGCKVRPNGIAMLNKIKMKTENCPQNLW